MRILIVDDDRLLRRILSEGLRAEGAECEEAAGGADALRAAISSPPDVVLLDMHLPDMDGLSVARALSARPETAATRLFLLTGSEDDDLKEKALAAGVRGVLRKPLTPALVYRRIRES
jgi:CheY-like chemotaxis protein